MKSGSESDGEDAMEMFPYRVDHDLNEIELLQSLDPATAQKFHKFCEEEEWTTAGHLQQGLRDLRFKDRNLRTRLDTINAMIYPARVDKDNIEVVRTLASGNFGTVYEAKWVRPGRRSITVAYKILVSDEADLLATEFNTWRKIPPHPNIARLYGAVYEGSRMVGLIAEKKADSLDSKVRKHGLAFPEDVILRILVGVAQGLNHLHEQNIVHRDLFARNILLNSRLIPVITDFGLSREAVYISQSGRPIPVGGAPEAIQSGVWTLESDVYSLAVVAWEMINPFQPVPSPLTFCKSTREVGKIALMCSNPDPRSRPKLSRVIQLCKEAITRLYHPLGTDDLLELLEDLNIPDAKRLANDLVLEKFPKQLLQRLPFDYLQGLLTNMGVANGDVVKIAMALDVKLTAPRFMATPSNHHVPDHLPLIRHHSDPQLLSQSIGRPVQSHQRIESYPPSHLRFNSRSFIDCASMDFVTTRSRVDSLPCVNSHHCVDPRHSGYPVNPLPCPHVDSHPPTILPVHDSSEAPNRGTSPDSQPLNHLDSQHSDDHPPPDSQPPNRPSPDAQPLAHSPPDSDPPSAPFPQHLSCSSPHPVAVGPLPLDHEFAVPRSIPIPILLPGQILPQISMAPNPLTIPNSNNPDSSFSTKTAIRRRSSTTKKQTMKKPTTKTQSIDRHVFLPEGKELHNVEDYFHDHSQTKPESACGKCNALFRAFARNSSQKEGIEVPTITIPLAIQVGRITFYVLKIPVPNVDPIYIKKRYSDFDWLDDRLKERHKNIKTAQCLGAGNEGMDETPPNSTQTSGWESGVYYLPPMPPKRKFWRPVNPFEFANERRKAFEQYLTTVFEMCQQIPGLDSEIALWLGVHHNCLKTSASFLDSSTCTIL